jgi:hypothetical protein
MSRGPGKLQTSILAGLRGSREPMSTAALRRDYEFEIWEPKTDPEFEIWNTPKRRRSVHISIGRALRQLEAAGQIKRNEAGDWYPAKDWSGRDAAQRQRTSTAYHEAGHAVIGLALKLPIAFVTIKPRAYSGGHVSQAPVHHGVGEVYARASRSMEMSSYCKPIADMSDQDAFGNKVETPDRSEEYWHSDIVMSIAGGMAEAEFMKDGSPWHELGSAGDKRCIAFARRKLGDKAGSLEEYEAECAKLVKQHWPMIEAVAAKLLKEETLSGNDVYSTCWRASRNVVRRQHLRTKR